VPALERLTLAASGTIPAGTTVTVTLPDRYLLLGAAIVYGLPLGGLLGGASIAGAFFGSDLAAAAGAGLGALAALLAASPLRRRLERATLQRLGVHRIA
jgi:sigma-E factor negative regulatory protein RseC